MFKRRVSRAAAVCALAIAMVVGGPAVAAQAAYYNTYSDIALTPTVGDCTAVEGFAAGATYLYSIKVRTSDYGRSMIYRVNKSSGAREVMTNGTDGGSYNSWLGHANDMTIVDIGGQHHMFVVTLGSTGYQVVKLRYDGTTYYRVASYYVRLNGAVIAPSGINRVSVTSTAVNFMFKSGRTIYNGSVALNAGTGTTINLTKAFDLQVDGALVNGAPVTNPGPLSTFANQGFFYDETSKVLYYPLTNANVSIVLVYRNVSPTTTGTAPAADDLSFRITSSVYSDKFEIEGLGISDGNLYFNTNRETPTDSSKDGVHVFDGFVAP